MSVIVDVVKYLKGCPSLPLSDSRHLSNPCIMWCWLVPIRKEDQFMHYVMLISSNQKGGSIIVLNFPFMVIRTLDHLIWRWRVLPTKLLFDVYFKFVVYRIHCLNFYTGTSIFIFFIFCSSQSKPSIVQLQISLSLHHLCLAVRMVNLKEIQVTCWHVFSCNLV